MKGSAHHGPTHDRMARAFKAIATANPLARCVLCHRTLAELPAHRTGRRPWWVAGHRRPGVVAHSLDDYQLECSHCSAREGARRTADAARPNRVTRTW